MGNLKRSMKKALTEPGYALSVLKKRLASQLSYLLFSGRSVYPETISLFLTYNCNLRCNMCGYWGACGATKSRPDDFLNKELSLTELEKLVDEVSSFAPNITLFGGEPLLYREWLSLVNLVKNKGLRCNIVTNATLLNNQASEIIDSNLDEIIFSLEGPREIHDRITQVKGSFDTAIRGLEEIQAEKKKRFIRKPYLNIACTISEDNYRFLEEILDIGASTGADSITFHHLCFINRLILDRHNKIFKRYFGVQSYNWSGFVRERLPKIDIEYLIKEVERINSSKYPLEIFFYPNFREEEMRQYYTNFEFKPSSFKNRCLSPWMTTYIFPDGSVRPCEELDFSCGNIKEKKFREIWNSPCYMDFRKFLKKIKTFPVCSRCTELYRF